LDVRVSKKRLVWMFDWNRVRGFTDDPKPFSIMNGRIRDPSQFPESSHS
jgi:hypothetical protein